MRVPLEEGASSVAGQFHGTQNSCPKVGYLVVFAFQPRASYALLWPTAAHTDSSPLPEQNALALLGHPDGTTQRFLEFAVHRVICIGMIDTSCLFYRK